MYMTLEKKLLEIGEIYHMAVLIRKTEDWHKRYELYINVAEMLSDDDRKDDWEFIGGLPKIAIKVAAEHLAGQARRLIVNGIVGRAREVKEIYARDRHIILGHVASFMNSKLRYANNKDKALRVLGKYFIDVAEVELAPNLVKKSKNRFAVDDAVLSSYFDKIVFGAVLYRNYVLGKNKPR